MIIQTERLNIRLSTDDEMRELIKNEKDEGLRQAYSEMLGLSEKEPWARQWYAAWFIESREGKRLGDLCFKGLTGEESVEIGYGILPEYQRNGYATEAVGAVTEWAFLQPGVKIITAETEEDNAASQSVLNRNGFLPTGKRGAEGPLFELKKR